MAPFKAWIIPIDDNGKPPQTPPGIWGGANEPFPTPPIYLPGTPGQRPPGIWGGANEPFPTPPIVIPPDKPGTWPPPNPAHPAHPIVTPPPSDKPPGGGDTGSITNPINLPPDTLREVQHGFWQLAFFPELGGWVWTWVVVDVAKGKK